MFEPHFPEIDPVRKFDHGVISLALKLFPCPLGRNEFLAIGLILASRGSAWGWRPWR
jgi:hypothetical protein